MAAVSVPEFDPAEAEAFVERTAGILDAGALAVMISVGHRTGLFDVMAAMAPATSDQIAARAELAERYVREWLAAMVTGRIVRYEPAKRRYSLPPEHAACLTRGAPMGNLAVYSQHVALLGQMQEAMLERFETGAGMRYEDYPDFHQLMAEDSDQTVAGQLFDVILPMVPGIGTRLDAGIEVLDAGCGRGRALIRMAERYPASRFTGYDLCVDAIEHARRVAADAGLKNVRFEVRDLADLDELDRYDFVTSFDAIHDQKQPQDFLCRLHGALRPGGQYLVQDIGGSARLENNLDFPLATFLYAISCFHCTPVSLGQGGEGLGTMWGWETALDMLRRAGFGHVERHVLPHDPMNVWFVAHRAG